MLAKRSDLSCGFRFFTLFVLAAFLPNASWAQLSGVVTPSRLIATTRDQVPGMPPGVTFFDDSYLCCAGLGQPVLSQGSKVAFVGVADGPFSIPSVFLGGGGFGLANVTPPGSEPPPVNVPFSVWYLSGPGRVFLDGNTVVFDGTRYDYLCDTEITCSLAQADGIADYYQGAFAPDFMLESSAYGLVALAYDGGSLLYHDLLTAEIRLGSSTVFTDGDMIDGVPVYTGGFGFKSGVGVAFSGYAGGSFEPGIWKQDTTPLGAVATTATEMPGFPGVTFAAFGAPAVGSPAVGSGVPPLSATVVFQGYADFDHQGIYRGTAGVTKVADTTDSVMSQGFPVTLYQFDTDVAVDGLDIAFTANNDWHVIVAEAATGGTLRTALSRGDTLRFGRKHYTVWELDMGPDSFSQGNIVLRGRLSEDPDPLAPKFDAVFIIDADGNGIGGPGSSQADPIGPTSVEPDPGSGLPVSHFEDAPSVAWIDPPLASGFTYAMTGGSLFTAILDLPTGFNAPFEVLVGAVSLGSFSPGTVIDFGAGVNEFTIQGIDPAVDAESHAPFAVQLEFDTLYASFTATPIPAPEPAIAAVMPIAMLGLALLGRSRSRRAPRDMRVGCVLAALRRSVRRGRSWIERFGRGSRAVARS